jgi:hypothetical protein
MGPATETIFFPIKIDVDPKAPLAEAATILSRQPGFRNAYHGPLVEDGKIHCVFVEWEGRDAVDAWTKCADAEGAKQKLMGLVDMEGGAGPLVSE